MTCGYESKPACGPNESEMKNKTWEFDGHELKLFDGGNWFRLERWNENGHLLFCVGAGSLKSLYDAAVKAGCVEVALPVACPMCGGEAKAIKDKGVVYTPHAVVCDGSAKCYIKGPSRESRNEAVTAWNDMAAMIARGREPRTADK